MSTVAEQLRTARESKKITIEQVAEVTKIRTDHVRALEEGRFNVFSATIYIRGSVRNYAKFLKLDETQLLVALDDELKATEKFSEPPPLTEQKKNILDHIALMVAKINWKVGFAGLVVLIMVLVLLFSLLAWRHHHKSNSVTNLPPAVYHPANSGETLPLPGHK